MTGIRRTLVVVAIGVVFALTVQANDGSLPEAGLEQWNRAVAARYESLSLMPRRERMVALLQLPPRMQESLWILHAQHILAAHPNLTAAQRSVIFERIGLLTDGNIGYWLNGGPQQKTDADEATREVLDRARTLLPMYLVKDLFYEIQKPGTVAFQPRVPKARTNDHGGSHSGITWCECSTEYGCDPFCEPGGPLGCTPTVSGCGPNGLEACNGTCIR